MYSFVFWCNGIQIAALLLLLLKLVQFQEAIIAETCLRNLSVVLQKNPIWGRVKSSITNFKHYNGLKKNTLMLRCNVNYLGEAKMYRQGSYTFH